MFTSLLHLSGVTTNQRYDENHMVWYRLTGNTCSSVPIYFKPTLDWRPEGTNKRRNKKRRQKQRRITYADPSKLDKKKERIQSIAFKLFASPVPCVTLGPKNLPFWEAPCFDHVLVLPFSIPRGGPVRSRRGTTSPGGV